MVLEYLEDYGGGEGVVLEDQKEKVDARGVVNWGWDGQCGNVVCRVTDGAA